MGLIFCFPFYKDNNNNNALDNNDLEYAKIDTNKNSQIAKSKNYLIKRLSSSVLIKITTNTQVKIIQI